MHRRIYKQSDRYVIREDGSGRDIGFVPIVPLFESVKPAEKLAREIRLLPELLSYLRHRSFHGDQKAAKLLEDLR